MQGKYDNHKLYYNVSSDSIKKIHVTVTVETREMIIGAILVNLQGSPEDTAAGKVFIYKNESPVFIEVNMDESYIEYLFKDPWEATYKIADNALKMLTSDYPGAILNMEVSSDIGCIRLPHPVKGRK